MLQKKDFVIMRLSLVPQLLLVFTSVLALTRAQSTSAPTTLEAQGIFYPFGSASGDTINPADNDGSSSVIPLLSPFLFFGRTYQQIYVNNNGHLTFNMASTQNVPYSFPANGSMDIIAGLWTDLDNRARGVVSYRQYTNGSVLTRATQDINNHFPDVTFSASWVFVATWDKVAYFNLTSTETSFQVVLIADSNFSFILMNYGDIAVTGHQVEAGFDTVNSTDYFVIPGSNSGSFISNLKNSSNANVPGRWIFRVDSRHNTSNTIAPTISPSTTSASTTLAALAIFYPFGSAAGDSEHFNASVHVNFSTPFVFFGRTYNNTYVNKNGLLTFSQPLPESLPYYIPKNGTEDFIAPLWIEPDDFGMGKYWYQQYTSGSVLARATQDINRYFPQRGFTASWVFVATWDFVQTWNTSIFNLHSAPAISFQVVLISGGGFSFILMNYGDCAAISSPVEAGYDTVNSTDYYQIPYANNGSYIPNLKNTTNVNVPGRWAFLVNSGSAPEIFYPFGSSGDTINPRVDDGSSSVIPLLSPFLFFGRTYQQIYVNSNGHLTFNQPLYQFVPYSFPANGSKDIIAGLWTDLDNRARGVVSYRQFTNGSVLTRATQDINNHFPNLTFSASWVFVATWDKVAYFPLTNTEISFQVVLISGSHLSFILMNYGDIAVTGLQVEAGYDTVNSTDYFVIPGSKSGSFISNLKNSSNVNVPGRWIFRVDSGSKSNNDNVVGLQVKLSSVLDLIDSGNIEIVLQQIKQVLVNNGLPSSIELELRNMQKIKP